MSRDPHELPFALQTDTNSSLLEGLTARHDDHWQRFVDRYRPLIVAFSRRRGLQYDDAQDLAQTILLEFSRAYLDGSYQREKGRLRSWLFGIANRQLANYRRQRRRPAAREAQSDTGVLAAIPAGKDLQAQWDEQWENAVLNEALREVATQVEAQTYRAFEEFALKNRPAVDVASELGVSENAVYGAKRRVLARLHAVLPLMRDVW